MNGRPRFPIRIRSLLALAAAVSLLSDCVPKKAEKITVGILAVYTFTAAIDGFKAGLAEQGYVEGENAAYDTFVMVSTSKELERAAIHDTIGRFIRAKVSLIFVMGTPMTIAAEELTRDTGIPVVFANALVETGNLIRSVQEPGGNITGVRFPGADLTVKRLELLLRITPKVKRVWVTFDPKNASAAAAITALRPAARSAGVTLVEAPIAGVADIKADLKAREAAVNPGFDAILIMPEGFSQSPEGFGMISKFAEQRNLPVAGSAAYEAERGAVFTYIPDDREIGMLAAKLAAKIFKGTPAGSIPVVTPESRLRLNYARAQKLGLRIDEGLMKLSDEIIR
ncbi:MAG: ABC transporter substrate-binding protein [Spirochaetales bacterium]|nr:ABC transporter substrate-binding protein [Spirochaetales bacterium]